MGEVLYVHYLLLHPNEQAVRRVLRSSSPPVDIPTELVDGLRFLFINIGVARTLIPFQVGTLIETVEQWKELEPGGRDRLLDDPWAFKEFLFSRQFTSRLLVNKQNTGGLERHLLLHNSYANGGVDLLTDFSQALPRRPFPLPSCSCHAILRPWLICK